MKLKLHSVFFFLFFFFSFFFFFFPTVLMNHVVLTKGPLEKKKGLEVRRLGLQA